MWMNRHKGTAHEINKRKKNAMVIMWALHLQNNRENFTLQIDFPINIRLKSSFATP